MPLTWLILRVIGFGRTREIAETETGRQYLASEISAYQFAQRCAELAAIASRNNLYRANCLHQALPLCWVLRRKGLPARLRIGVAPRVRPFHAHAWVELNGIALGQKTLSEYEVFERLGNSYLHMASESITWHIH